MCPQPAHRGQPGPLPGQPPHPPPLAPLPTALTPALTQVRTPAWKGASSLENQTGAAASPSQAVQSYAAGGATSRPVFLLSAVKVCSPGPEGQQWGCGGAHTRDKRTWPSAHLTCASPATEGRVSHPGDSGTVREASDRCFPRAGDSAGLNPRASCSCRLQGRCSLNVFPGVMLFKVRGLDITRRTDHSVWEHYPALSKFNTSRLSKWGRKEQYCCVTHLRSGCFILNYLGEFTFSFLYF